MLRQVQSLADNLQPFAAVERQALTPVYKIDMEKSRLLATMH